jgi:hypothetical protein
MFGRYSVFTSIAHDPLGVYAVFSEAEAAAQKYSAELSKVIIVFDNKDNYVVATIQL